ncbi:hypothetical protein WICPIJ_005216 [Wickerhamomyces pijperi]|uniref:Uncharacterized protein n=1 Tax=Wickerhamomyces pijperi TaxID=599730 RepID=A0A9P8Q4J4_WICPI|nr:hypothetical protein WICPIJ_005216 [Wickerhamomyces pijperi]
MTGIGILVSILKLLLFIISFKALSKAWWFSLKAASILEPALFKIALRKSSSLFLNVTPTALLFVSNPSTTPGLNPSRTISMANKFSFLSLKILERMSSKQGS